jgi:hypothetical protein
MDKHISAATLTAGKLYIAMIEDLDGQAISGALVFFAADGEFYDADTGDEWSPDYDYLVEQVGAFNKEYASL